MEVPRFEMRPLVPGQSMYGCDAVTRAGYACSRFPATWACTCGQTFCTQHANAHVPGHARIVRGEA